MTTFLGLALLVALAPPDRCAEADEGEPPVAASGCCVPDTCESRLTDGFLDVRRCRPAHWTCFNDPCTSCVSCAWAPARVALAAALLPIVLVEPTCKGPLPDLDDVALFFAFGTPLKKCPEPNIPKGAPPDDEPPPAPPDGPLDAVMRF